MSDSPAFKRLFETLDRNIALAISERQKWDAQISELTSAVQDLISDVDLKKEQAEKIRSIAQKHGIKEIRNNHHLTPASLTVDQYRIDLK